MTNLIYCIIIITSTLYLLHVTNFIYNRHDMMNTVDKIIFGSLILWNVGLIFYSVIHIKYNPMEILLIGMATIFFMYICLR
jgi:hypothetical protein